MGRGEASKVGGSEVDVRSDTTPAIHIVLTRGDVVLFLQWSISPGRFSMGPNGVQLVSACMRDTMLNPVQPVVNPNKANIANYGQKRPFGGP